MKEKIDLFLEDFKGRIRNPFITSFIFVWFLYHWTLIYYVFSVSDKLPASYRLSKILEYNHTKGWWGMMVLPFLTACISLPFYYLIANASQWIYVWLGKRLYAFILIKNDTGKVVLKTELEKEKKKIKELKDKLTLWSKENEHLESEKLELNEMLSQNDLRIAELSDQLEFANNNIYRNKDFKTHLIRALIYLLSKETGSQVVGALTRNIENFKLSTFKGSWEIKKHKAVESNHYETLAINIDNEIITRFDGTYYGEIIEFPHDLTTSLCILKIRRTIEVDFLIKNEEIETYNLLCINKNEFIGLHNGHYVTFMRKEDDKTN